MIPHLPSLNPWTTRVVGSPLGSSTPYSGFTYGYRLSTGPYSQRGRLPRHPSRRPPIRPPSVPGSDPSYRTKVFLDTSHLMWRFKQDVPPFFDPKMYT